MRSLLFLFIVQLFSKNTHAQVISFLTFNQRYPAIAYHLTEADLLNTLVNSSQYYDVSDSRSMNFRKYRSEFLRDKTLAAKTVTAQVVKIEKTSNFFYSITKQMNTLSGHLLDSIFAVEKITETMTLRYDRSGRLKKRTRYQTEFENQTTSDTVFCNYKWRGRSSKTTVRIEKYEDRKIAGYQSLYLDEHINGPTLSHSSWRFSLRFDHKDRLICIADTYFKFTNGKKDYKPHNRIKSFAWNAEDRVVLTKDSLTIPGQSKITNYSYAENSLNINRDVEKYPALKSKPLCNWIRQSFDSLSLSLVSFFANDSGETNFRVFFS